MKYPLKPFVICFALAGATILSSCKKEDSLATAGNAAIATAALQMQAIAVSASATTPGDSVYVINTCPLNSTRDSISASSLPSSITDYLNTNYPGYALQKAFTVKDVSSTLQGYIVIVQFNNNPVGLKFDAAGAFVQILEQREGHNLLGRGWHDGGHFGNRDGKQRDTISLAALPPEITSYFAAEYVGDTLIRASKTRDSGYIVLSRDNGLFATVFNSSAQFVSRVELPAQRGLVTPVDQNGLPANVLSYLTSTYPGYVFNKAFSITGDGVVQGYCVVIEANDTRYAIQFDAAGNFIAAKAIR